VPFLPVEDRIYSDLFLKEWTEYALRQDYHGIDFETRIEYLFTRAGVKHTKNNGRVAASIFAWMGTSVGLSHIEILADKFYKNKNNRGSVTNDILALHFWSEYSSRTDRHGFRLGYKLQELLNKVDSDASSFKKINYDELSLAQAIFVYISNYEGLEFLMRTLKKINEDKEDKKEKLLINT
jgi:hypothetical protein